MHRKRPLLIRMLPYLLWVMPLVFPVFGLFYVGMKRCFAEPLGPYSIALLIGSFIWCLLTIVPLWNRRFRELIVGQRLVLMAAYSALLLSVLLAELLLTGLDIAMDLPPCHPLSMSWWAFAPQAPALSATFITDHEFGSRYADPENPNFNSQGFRDRDEFVGDRAETDDGLNVLLIGDSFAFGSAAVRDGSNSGFADVLQQRLNAIPGSHGVVWNTGIPGTGQAEQVLHLRRWLPVLKPNLVILSLFAGNDLQDNVFPPGQFYVFTDGTWANRYTGSGDAVQGMTPRAAWLRSQGYGVESGHLLLKLRTISAAWRVISDTRRRWNQDARRRELQRQLSRTRALIGEIATVCRDAQTEMLILLIPKVQTLSRDEDLAVYQELRSLIGALQVKLVDMRPLLSPDDYTPAPDEHWTKVGHRKAAAALADTILSD
ncbi:MAG: GDSL-type esterase/lipase family protein [Planctomycetaceae bacterium]